MVLLFGATSLQAIHQSATEDIATLTIWQAVNAVLAAVVAVGFWRSTRWTWLAVVAWTASTAVMIELLGPLLDLPGPARAGLIPGALTVATLGAVSAWYARRIAH